ncbi:C40 family peptidase [Tatumella ptyseos]|uniref:C40 family peptidase n=1 Tax=Tatumella ptyseos TaxID=82987 RepID=UPI0026EF2424|nr:NlpC/P60 family protein [Tatumella ptyseos]WKX28023.1 NlpC/P60 family protein [Tatumella ptyseos]
MSVLAVLLTFLLIGCSSHAPSPDARLSNPRMVHQVLSDQLVKWRGTPYRYGGLSRSGIDCSGFVYRTFRERFDIQLPRTTRQQSDIGTRIRKKDLLPGDLVFFKTGWGEGGLHVGIYDTQNQFIHASTSRGVMRSSLNNVYWRKVFWQARRL